LAGSGTKKIIRAITAASNLSSAKGSAIASPWRNSATRAAGRVRAKASCPSDGSMPWTSADAQRSTSSWLKAPLPQPMSIHRKPARGASR
jgi:hypothetical protein